MTEQNESSGHFSFINTDLLPQEEMLEVGAKHKKLSIGIPKENHESENCVPITPEAVELLVNNGHEIYLERGAGKGANYSDTDYSERGGQILDTAKEVFQCEIILKVAPLTLEEITLLKGRQLVFSSLLPANQTEVYYRELMDKRITAISFEKIKDENNSFPVVRTMSNIAGKTAILIAAEYLSNAHKGKGVMLGGLPGITPTEVVILGAGYVAESAIRASLGLGAFVKVFDQSISKLRQLEHTIGANIYTSIFHPQVLDKAIRSTEVLIVAIAQDENKGFLITEEMVKSMKKGSVIIDMSFGQGNCVETSELRTTKSPTCTKHGVIHHCVPNITSMVSRTSTISLSNVFTPMFLEMGESGGINQYIKRNPGLRNGIYIYNGILTNSFIGKYFDIPFKDIELLMAAF